MRTIILSLCCFLAVLCVKAQTPNFEWAKKVGNSNSYQQAYSVKTDAIGNFYHAGVFGGTIDFDLGAGVFNMSATSAFYLSKASPSSSLIWAKQIKGPYLIPDITIDHDGNMYVVGLFKDTVDFDPGTAVFNLISDTLSLFILKLDTNGDFVWAKGIISTSEAFDISPKIEVDDMGNVYVAGAFFDQTIDFDPSAAQHNLTAFGFATFILKLTASGDFLWANSIDNTGVGWGNQGSDLAVDRAGSVCIVGYLYCSSDFDPSTAVYNVNSLNPTGDVFIAKYRFNGTLLWVKTIAGDSTSGARCLAIDNDDNILVSGVFTGSAVDFDPNVGVYNMSVVSSIGFDNFILKLDIYGDFIWAKSMAFPDYVYAITTDAGNNVYISSAFSGTVDFDFGPGVHTLTSNNQDSYVLKLNAAGDFLWVGQVTGVGTANNYSYSMCVDGNNNIYIVGYFYGLNDFDIGSSTSNLTSIITNVFVLKLNQNTVGITEEAFHDLNIKTYPNPTKDIFTLSITNPTNDLSLSLYNSLGALIYQKKQLDEENKIDLSHEASGLFMMALSKNGLLIANEKIIKE